MPITSDFEYYKKECIQFKGGKAGLLTSEVQKY
jgi:hypothetical protein